MEDVRERVLTALAVVGEGGVSPKVAPEDRHELFLDAGLVVEVQIFGARLVGGVGVATTFSVKAFEDVLEMP